MLDGRPGSKITVEGGALCGEIGQGCGVGEEGLGAEAVAAAVAGGLLFSDAGDRSAGSGAVDPGGFALSCSSHFGSIMHEGFAELALKCLDCFCFVGVKNLQWL